MTGGRPILCLNAGSSSLKFALYELASHTEGLIAQGAVERIGLPGSRLWLRGARQSMSVDTSAGLADHQSAVAQALGALETHACAAPAAVGHRIVHGGAAHAAPECVTPQLLDQLRRLVPFAPLHLPSAIQVIETVAARFPGLMQVACFDTAFHRRMPEVAQRLPLPQRLWDAGVRRYGFHGLSYEYIVERLQPAATSRSVIAHLGNGASMVALRGDVPLDTTMGFTPTGGFMMGTRSGDLDPGILIYLLNHERYDASQLEQLVNHESGLLGVSGISSDMKTLLEQRQRHPGAAQAVELFCYQLRKSIGALAAMLGGLDTLVFTGGIGERAAPVRWVVCAGLAYLGIVLDEQRNESHADTISTAESRCTVRVMPTNEDMVIARHTRRLLPGDTTTE